MFWSSSIKKCSDIPKYLESKYEQYEHFSSNISKTAIYIHSIFIISGSLKICSINLSTSVQNVSIMFKGALCNI